MKLESMTLDELIGTLLELTERRSISEQLGVLVDIVHNITPKHWDPDPEPELVKRRQEIISCAIGDLAGWVDSPNTLIRIVKSLRKS